MDVYKEISLFFNEPLNQVKNKCREAHFRLHRLWKEASPKSEKHRNIWYKTTDAQIYEQANWHQGHLSKRREIAEKASGEILCFGSGIGTEGIMAAEMGKNLTFYDLPGLTYNFLKFRVSLRNLKNVKFIEKELAEKKRESQIYYEGEDFGMYDTIICIDVLEHLEHPQEMLNFLSKHLKSEGIILISAPFKALEYFSHLPQNKNLDIHKMMKKAGIKRFKSDILESENVSLNVFETFLRFLQESFYKIKFVFS